MPTNGIADQYEGGEPDARLSPEPLPSLFRKRYRQLAPFEMELHDQIKDKADELARLILLCVPPEEHGHAVSINRRANALDKLAGNRGANVTLSLRHLEDAVYRAAKALTT